ncbi:MAG: isoaspartyl peptidase/L-asparaginase [Planctomycetales bacterium 12-60-4]|nr:MAG: isoaspartyl peptidase/L-asparaginase [Planctomycetales bacterium 12-60-4]
MIGRMWIVCLGSVCAGCLLMTDQTRAGDAPIDNVVLGIHGGISPRRKDLSPEEEQAVREVLTNALRTGKAQLDSTGSSLDAVEAAIRIMEDSPLLNAGKGAVFTREGRNELDASIMEGTAKRAGAVAGVTVIRNPITAARAVMEKSPHVLLMGRGAEVFATQQGLDIVDPAYFWTEPRWREIQKLWEAEKSGTSAISRPDGLDQTGPTAQEYSTVGAVARDAQGHLAAGTSTGGRTGKAFGRIGDSPIIGAGTYADDAAAAISCTGHGEYFIRLAVAHEIVAQMKYRGNSVSVAANDVIERQLTEAGGTGAAIVLDHQGRFVTSYNTDGLYRGAITQAGEVTVRLFGE